MQSKTGDYVITTGGNVYVPNLAPGGSSIGNAAYQASINNIANVSGYTTAYWQMYHDVVIAGSGFGYSSSNAGAFNSLLQQVVTRIGSSNITQDIHYARNGFNRAPDTLNDLIAYNKANPGNQWVLLPPIQAAFHMSGSNGIYNVKFISADGHFEVVYDKSGNKVTAAQNMGTYNFYGPSDAISHSNYDVNPYYDYGNTSQDKALKTAGALFMAADNFETFNDSIGARNRYYEVMKEVDPEAYKAYEDQQQRMNLRRK